MEHREFAEEPIIAALKEAGAGASTTDLCRRYGMSDARKASQSRSIDGRPEIVRIKSKLQPHLKASLFRVLSFAVAPLRASRISLYLRLSENDFL